MIQDSLISSVRPAIPASAYKSVKRCPNCHSVYLTDTNCEACGRSLLYHPIGEPFSAKSLYGFKERYYGSLEFLVRHFPVLENKESDQAKSYVRQILKRFDDLLEAFGKVDAIESKNRRLFYVETMELIDELLRYGVSPTSIQQKIEISILETGPLLTKELLLYLNETKETNQLSEPWKKVLMSHRVVGIRVEMILKMMLITATVLAMAVSYYHFISLQVGK